MTLYAIISDIHANYDALLAVEADALNVAKNLKEDLIYICLGDVVDYGPEPNECMNWLTEQEEKGQIYMVRGNHDKEVADDQKPTTVDTLFWPTTMWTRQTLTDKHKECIRGWQMQDYVAQLDFALVHGSFIDNSSYIREVGESARNFEVLHSPTKNGFLRGFFGHSHYQGYFTGERDGYIGLKYKAKQHFAIEENDQTCKYFSEPGLDEIDHSIYTRAWLGVPVLEKNIMNSQDLDPLPDSNILFNPGSVGQPRRPQTWTGNERNLIAYDSRAAYLLLLKQGAADPRFAFRRKTYCTAAVLRKLASIKWQEAGATNYFDLIKSGFQERSESDLAQISGKDANFVENVMAIIERDPIDHKKNRKRGIALHSESETVSKLNAITQYLIKEKLSKFFYSAR
ncbi:MAG: metallophosphoesterase [Chloroflexota bacterium]